MLRYVAAFAVWITFAIGFCPSPWDARQVWFGGDQALLLRAADDVLAGDPPLVGAYSKGSLYHPGPLFSYLVALVQWTTRGHLEFTNTVVSVIQAATVPVLMMLAHRVSGSWLVALTVPLLIVFNFSFLFYVRIIWNVAIVLPLLSLALWLTWEVTPTSTWRLPLLTFILCFLAQAHMAFTPLAMTLGIVATARFVSSGIVGRWRVLGVTGAVALACWSPVLWDAIRHDGGGNLGALLQYFGREELRGHDLRTAWGAIHGVGLQAMPRGFPLLSTLALSTILMASTFWRRDDHAMRLRWLTVVLGCAWLAALFSISRIPDAIEPYYLRPLSILLVVHLSGGVAALLLWLRTWKRVGVMVEAAIAVAVIAIVAPLAREEWRRFRTASWNGYPLREVQTVARSISLDLLGARAREAIIRVEFQPSDLSGAAASVVYVLQREGIALSGDTHAPAYRILAPPDRPIVGGRGRELVRTAKFRVERVVPDETANE